MKFFNLILFVSILLARSVFAQEEVPDQENEQKQKKVKTRIEYIHFLDKATHNTFKCQKKYFDKNGNDTLLLVYSITSNKVFSKIIKKFDSFGNIIERKDYKITSSIKEKNKKDPVANNQFLILDNGDNFMLDMYMTSEYGKKGKYLSSKKYDGNMYLINEIHVSYVYDKAGHIIEVNNVNSDSDQSIRILYGYDSLGNKVNFEYYIAGTLRNHMTYIYNNDKKPVKIVIERPLQKTVETEYYYYDKKGNIIKKELYDGKDELVISSNWKYSNKGELIELTREPKKMKIDVYKTVFTYDKYGNVRKNMRYNREGKNFRIHEFVYSYYN